MIFLPFLILLIIYLSNMCCGMCAQALSFLMSASEVFSRPKEQEGALCFLEQGRTGRAVGCCSSVTHFPLYKIGTFYAVRTSHGEQEVPNM